MPQRKIIYTKLVHKQRTVCSCAKLNHHSSSCTSLKYLRGGRGRKLLQQDIQRDHDEYDGSIYMDDSKMEEDEQLPLEINEKQLMKFHDVPISEKVVRKRKGKREKQNKDTFKINLIVGQVFKGKDLTQIEKPIEIPNLVKIQDKSRNKRDDGDSLTPKGSNLKVIMCTVRREDLNSEYLQRRFKKQYIEGNSFPRRFAIFSEAFNPGDIYVVVTVVDEDEKSFCRIEIKIANVSTDHTFSSLQNCNQFSNTSGRYEIDFKYLLEECFPQFNTDVLQISTCSLIIPQIQTTKIIPRQYVRPVRLQDVWKTICQSESSTESQLITSAKKSNDICPICLSFEKMVYITDCNHRSCKSCLRTYIDLKISATEDDTISCFNFACEEQLDTITVLSFLDKNLSRKFIQRKCEVYLAKTTEVKHCPNETCNAIAAVRSTSNIESGISNNVAVVCSCIGQ